ncbi:ORF112 [Spodoptera eridania nucleopolyhedrovirus]|uniref:ORF112 n=1 Tax=Spodoptera eridania nucleopolyhedrovirus TaxID=2315721 RepID=A0A346TQ47_9ABAC|nr:ORF112 [Spodoptera eridania nucleopolyhedrovirus]AXU41707.1 ORF112 [Spodoptera eridania nucleopolyhedrovirus]
MINTIYTMISINTIIMLLNLLIEKIYNLFGGTKSSSLSSMDLEALPQEIYDKICGYLDLKDYMNLLEATKRVAYGPEIMISEQDFNVEYPEFMEQHDYETSRLTFEFKAVIVWPALCPKCNNNRLISSNCIFCASDCLNQIQQTYREYNDGMIGCTAYGQMDGRFCFGGAILIKALSESLDSTPCNILGPFLNSMEYNEKPSYKYMTSSLDQIIRKCICRVIKKYKWWKSKYYRSNYVLRDFIVENSNNKWTFKIHLYAYKRRSIKMDDLPNKLCKLFDRKNCGAWPKFILPNEVCVSFVRRKELNFRKYTCFIISQISVHDL